MRFAITYKFAVGIVIPAICLPSYLRISSMHKYALYKSKKNLKSGSLLRKGVQSVATLYKSSHFPLVRFKTFTFDLKSKLMYILKETNENEA